MGFFELLKLPGAASVVNEVPVTCSECGCREMYRQPDFRRSIGLWTVSVASVATVPLMVLGYDWLIIWSPMFLALILDRFFAWKSADVVICYECGQLFRGLSREQTAGLESFDLETYDRYRYKEMEAASGASSPQLP